MIYKVVLRRGEVSGYVVECPAIPGCVSQGRTKRAALTNIKDAMLGCLAVLNERAEREKLRHPAEDVVKIAV
ncbi:MAG: type II toxin-antitoxin system HicB family antitoxin [Candidatus Omnitrophica bacterium]|nr:type II toxin-antitoxin system HicB family antitoxin [Candidatus Omnitrophota bacterium]MBI3021178.1 type II toxin-antitoxin system HicB family antitoxin [Candidatus Omnitrophota bacterium]